MLVGAVDPGVPVDRPVDQSRGVGEGHGRLVAITVEDLDRALSQGLCPPEGSASRYAGWQVASLSKESDMNHDADRLVTRAQLWLQWADEHGVRYDDSGKSFDDVARDYYQTSDAYRELLTPALRGDGLSATHQAAANTAYARALLIEAAIEGRGGDLDLYVDPVQVRDPNGRIVPPQHGPETMGEWEDVVPCAAPQEPPQQYDAPTTDRGFRP